MDREDTWQVVQHHRLAIADLLDRLTPQQWESPSLCAGWRIRDVAAHVSLVAVPPSTGSLLAGAVRARGNFHRLNTLLTKARAQRSPQQLLADLREHAGSRNVPAVSNYRNVLFDVLVHGQDIALPLGLNLPIPPHAGAAAATRVWTMGWPFWAKRRLRGVRLSATDADWSAGSGPGIHGPIHALLLLLTGRTTTATTLLAGDGLARLTSPAPRDVK